MSENLTVADLERLYSRVVLQQQFYNDSYGSDWSLEPYEAMAQLLREVVGPKKHIDIGCGKAFLVLAMRRLGIQSFGLDFSEALIKQAPLEVKPYVEVARTEDWISNPLFLDTDLITYMEVFEHLPVSLCAFILKVLQEHFTGQLFITTPSFGIDERFKLGIRTNVGTPSWQRDMVENAPFHNIVLEDGLPHHGHITLCSYRWWTDFFLFHGWVRSNDLESRALKSFRSTLMKYNWNPYILEKLPSDLLDIDIASSNQLGFGWHELNRGTSAGRWTDGRAEVYFRGASISTATTVTVELTAPDVNVVKDFSLLLVGEQLLYTVSHKFRWIPLFTSLPVPIALREKRLTLSLKLLRASEVGGVSGPISTACRLTLISPSYSPLVYGLSEDRRTLGIIVHRLSVGKGVNE